MALALITSEICSSVEVPYFVVVFQQRDTKPEQSTPTAQDPPQPVVVLSPAKAQAAMPSTNSSTVENPPHLYGRPAWLPTVTQLGVTTSTPEQEPLPMLQEDAYHERRT
ncbi:MAG: S-type pyocin domain-containing protein [Candidatus Schekmanbacteria bacterium]|nr:S-type pyocin domain-containing protein [Candidatus Schekmanbacteria bacterium]